MAVLVRRILLLTGLLALLIGIGQLTPWIFKKVEFQKVLAQLKLKPPPQDTLVWDSLSQSSDSSNDWKVSLVEAFVKKNGLSDNILYKNPDNFWKLFVPRGPPLIQYGLDITKLARKTRPDSLRGEVVKSAVARFLFTIKKGNDSLVLQIQYGRTYKGDSFKFAVLWMGLDSIDVKTIRGIVSSKWNYNLLLNPYNANSNLKTLPRNSNVEIYSTLPLEPFHYPYVNPGRGALFIHNSQNEVEELLQDKLSKTPSARGFATTFGTRAIENPGLLKKILGYTKKQNLLFLDLTGSQRSVSAQVCRELSAACYRSIAADNVSRTLLQEKLRHARKYGSSLLAAAWTRRNIQIVESFLSERNLEKEGVEIVKLSSMFNSLNPVQTSEE